MRKAILLLAAIFVGSYILFGQTSPDYIFGDDYGSGWSWTTGTQGTASLGNSFKWQFQANANANLYFKFGETSSSADGQGFWCNLGSGNAQYPGGGNWGDKWTAYYFPNMSGGGAFYFTVVNGNYYVIKSRKQAGNNADFAVFNNGAQAPVTITSISHYISGNNCYVDVTLSGAKSSAEKVWVRYSKDNWQTSSTVEANNNISGNTWRATITLNPGEIMSYYSFTTINLTSAPAEADADFYTINYINNNGANYTAYYGTWIIDGNPSEWTGTPPSDGNSWKYSAGTAGGLNEWIWKDVQGDERTNLNYNNPDTRVDILEVRIASDATYLYFMVKMRDIDQATGDGAPMVQISIDRDRTPGSGEEWLGGDPNTRVHNDARWERLVTTRFGSNNTNLRVWTHSGGSTNWNNPSYTGDAAISATYEAIEGRIPWSDIGGLPGSSTIRFTFSSYRANTQDKVWWTTGNNQESDALDCVTTASSTWPGELSNTDNTIDYYVDIQFLNDQTLPVQTVLLTAVPGDSKITLVWETRNEIDNAGFEIFRKAKDENEFKLIASYTTNDALRGLGTNPHGKRYEYVDKGVRNGIYYEYKIYAVSFSGQRQELGVIVVKTGVEIPKTFVVYQNYPNPFNPGTEITFDLPEAGNVKVEIFNLLGEKVTTLYDGFMEAGYGRKIRWNADGFTSGIYFYRVSLNDKYVDVKKMVLVK